MLKTINQTTPQQQKIVVESREYEESVDLAKLQTSMLKLFYVNGKIDWDEGTVKNVTLATFAKGFKDLLGRTATVQEAQFANLLNTIFKSLPDEDEDELANPLERLMSLSVFPKKFTKAHLNASFQSADLETNMMYKNTSVNPFHYAPHNNRALIQAAWVEIEEECNEFNWRVNEKDKKPKKLDALNRWVTSAGPVQIYAESSSPSSTYRQPSPCSTRPRTSSSKSSKIKKRKLGCATTATPSRTCRLF